MDITIEGKTYSEAEVKALEKAGVLGIGYKNNPGATATADATSLQGPFPGSSTQFGIFSSPGVRPERFSAMQRPRTLARLLTPEPSEYYQEILEIMTGATSGSGSNATDFCDDPPEAGQLKTCQQIYKFGKYFLKTHINPIPEVGMLRNRADIPGRLLNSGPNANPLIPDIMYQITDTRNQLQYELFMVGVELERSLEKVLVQGNNTLASTNTQRGFISEFNGLDNLIKTGYVDAVTGVACPASDSDVINFNAAIGGTDAFGRTITNAISDLWYANQDRATQVGMEGAEMAFVCRKEMFRVLTDVYANNYATTRFTLGSAANPLLQDATSVNQLRMQMLQGQFLMVEGIEVPVVFSDGVPYQHIGANQFLSDLYLVPMSWQGRRLLRLEYFRLDNPYANSLVGWVNPEDHRVINNGMFFVGKQSTGTCVDYTFAAQMRLILETPFLAGRIDSVQFTYLADTRSAYPAETYAGYANGGATYRS